MSGDTGVGASFLAGHVNEKNLIPALKLFLSMHAPGAVVRSHRLYGLLQVEAGITVSPDCIMDMSWNLREDFHLVLVEFKTKVAVSTISEAASLSRTYGPYVDCAFDDDVCKEVICRDHRVQILHQVAVTGILEVLYVVTSKSSILQVVRVRFDDLQKDLWLQVVRIIIKVSAPFLKQDLAGLKLPVIPTTVPRPKCDYGGCPDQETFNLQFYLRRAAMQLITQRGSPLPTADRIVPITIAVWNKTKGMTDMLSRTLNNVKAPMQKLHPYGYMYTRMINMMMYNGHILHRLFAIEKRLKTKGEIKCLEQLRQALNAEGSFKASIANVVRRKPGSTTTTNGFKFSQILFSQHEKVTTVDHGAVAAQKRKSIGCSITGSMKSGTKLKFMNTPTGKQIRRESGFHTPSLHVDHLGSCMLCGARTVNACMTCSNLASKELSNSNVIFYVCITESHAPGGRLLPYTCFHMMHNADVLYRDDSRKKVVSEKFARHLQKMHGSNAAKRSHGAEADDDQDSHDDDDNGAFGAFGPYAHNE